MAMPKWILAWGWCWCVLVLTTIPSFNWVSAAPISFNFSTCGISTFELRNSTLVVDCCPVKPTKPIIDGLPPLTTKVLRVRKAAQCTDEDYAAKLARGYKLMRALPDDDPRSLNQQWITHCAYCGGAFFTRTPFANLTGIDIHWSWLFFPWHRYYIYFHERILQWLLEDPTFTLNYWNWDNPYTAGNEELHHGKLHPGKCLKAGSDFPAMYDIVSSPAFDGNRSANAKGKGRFRYPDLNFIFQLPGDLQYLYNATEEDLVASNINVMYQTMISGTTTAETFMGSPYRAGNNRGIAGPGGNGGAMELGPHSSIHNWVGQYIPKETRDMGSLAYAARDPVFFSHHANVDRLWEVWKSLGPSLGQARKDFSNPDFLHASFLFYDENKDLRRVRVTDCLDITKLGYVYQQANDASWIFVNQTKCSKLSHEQLLSQAKCLPVPIKDSKGYYHIEAGKPFVIIIDRPSNAHGVEEFLSIDGIKLDRMFPTGFDVFVNLLHPSSLTMPSKCAEFSGRLMNMATSLSVSTRKDIFTWKRSVTRTLVDISATKPPSKLVITLLPFGEGNGKTITFRSIAIST